MKQLQYNDMQHFAFWNVLKKIQATPQYVSFLTL